MINGKKINDIASWIYTIGMLVFVISVIVMMFVIS